MLKNISKIEGAHELTKNEQKIISGGKPPICETGLCLEHRLEDGKWVWRCMDCW